MSDYNEIKVILLPPIPQKLWRIDDSTVSEHFSLTESDLCYYIWEYAARNAQADAKHASGS